MNEIRLLCCGSCTAMTTASGSSDFLHAKKHKLPSVGY